uniref:6-bladed beta-propeller n=1 Tax=candidate division WOR-3 bacterium TaxID=2052148 RepID=A0A7C4U799_UNCW3
MDNEKILNYDMMDLKEVKINFNYASIFYTNGDNVYLFNVHKPIIRFNLATKEEEPIGKIGCGPGEYDFPSSISELNGNIYIVDTPSKRLLKFEHDGKFIEEISGIKANKIKFLNESLMVMDNPTLFENYFTTFDLKNKKEIKKFGKMIEYPIRKYRERLNNDGIMGIYQFLWDAMDSILVFYDYYNDNILLYNIFSGEIIKKFGRRHKNWAIPKVFLFEGDKYHPKSWDVSFLPCYNILISNKYIFVILEKVWKYHWYMRNISEKKWRKIETNNFYFVDIYKRDDFSYVGTLYPLNDFIWKDNKRWSLRWNNSVSGDSILNFYLDNKDGDIQKISIKWINN